MTSNSVNLILEHDDVTDDSGCDNTDDEKDDGDYIELDAVTVKPKGKSSPPHVVNTSAYNHPVNVHSLRDHIKPDVELSDKAMQMANTILMTVTKSVMNNEQKNSPKSRME